MILTEAYCLTAPKIERADSYIRSGFLNRSST